MSKKYHKIVNIDFFASLSGRYIEPVFLSLYLLYLIINHKITDFKPLLYFIILLLHGLIMSLFTGYDVGKTFQQTLLLFITVFAYIQIYKKCTVEYVFSVYLKFAFLISFLGLIQYGVYSLFEVNIFPYTLDLFNTQNESRLHSVLLEAGNVATFLAPSICYIFVSKTYFLENKSKSIIILLAFFFTYTSISVIAVILALFFRFYDRLRKFRVFFYCLVIAIIVSLYSYDYKGHTYNENSNVSDRAISKISESVNTIWYLTSAQVSPHNFEGLNVSTYAQLTNYWVAFNAPYRLVGTGIGTHAQNYEHLYRSNYPAYGQNKDDAYSLFGRLFSEFGYVGLLLYLVFLIRCFNKDNIISLCCFNFIICNLLRGGFYTLYCVALFHLLYYRCSKSIALNPQKIYKNKSSEND